jgi:sulfoquinovosidase
VPKQYQRVYVIFNHTKTNQYYGLGEQFSYLNLGHDRPFSTYVREKGVGRTEQPLTFLANMQHGAGGSYYTTYAPMPIWFSSRKVSYILNDYSYMAWINNKMLVWSD